MQPHGKTRIRQVMVRRRDHFPTLFFTLFLLSGSAIPICRCALEDYERAPILYSQTNATNEVVELQERIDSGSWSPDTMDSKSYLASVLDELAIPVESQVLVFSKTSLQVGRIHPRRPRAIYFSDNGYAGWVQGGDLELIIPDRSLGPVFYVMDGLSRLATESKEPKRPMIRRTRDCLGCHGGSRTGNVPGMLFRSVYPDRNGLPLYSAGTHLTEPGSPFPERWGGWYVTGQMDGPRHMGNLLYEISDTGQAESVRDHGFKLADLSSILNTDRLLTPRSDIVSLLVLEHQVAVHNAITQAAFSVRRVLHYSRILAEELGDTGEEFSETTERVLDSQVGRLLRVMMFHDETELPGWGVEGAESFQIAFQQNARRDSSGRSLKDFQLLSRLFKHRLSYMIYSRAFEALPEEFLSRFYRRLFSILTGEDSGAFGNHLPPRERQRILRILRETKPGLPDYWHSS